jgi:hypothetical protein
MLLIDSHIKDILLTKTKQNETTIKKRAIKTDAQQIRKKKYANIVDRFISMKMKNKNKLSNHGKFYV